MKKIFTLTIASFIFSYVGFSQQFTKVTGSAVTNLQEGYGCTWGDYDKDGDLDVYVNVRFPSVNNPGAHNYLFQNNCNGDFTRITAIPGGLVSEQGRGPATWIDYDNDEDEDLFISTRGANNFLYRNNGDGTFTKITDLPFLSNTPNSDTHTFIDYDNDGDLDVYIANRDRNIPFPPYEPSDLIYRNDGSGNYTLIPNAVNDSLATENTVWGDYDNDGYMDLVLETSPWPGSDPSHLLFHNNGNGTFSRATTGPNEVDQNIVGAIWVDYDNDLDLDIFVRNAFGVPNRLYRNNSDGTFTSVPDAGGLNSTDHNNGGVAWGDYDNDGDMDVYMSAFSGNLLYNKGDGTFIQDTVEIISNDTLVESYGAAWADYDNDGDLDLYVCNAFGTWESFLYRNNGGSSHWLDVKCKGTISNKDAIGARIYVKAVIGGQPRWQLREINNNLSVRLGGIGPKNQHFGIGDATVIDSLKIVWPVSGITQIFTNVSPDRFIEITEGVNAIADAMPCKPDLLPENPAVITGKTFSDTDNDCVFNSSNDFPVANRIMQATPGPNFVFSDSNGDYEFRLNEGTFNVTQATISNDLWNLQNCQPSGTHTVSVTLGDTFVGNDFAVKPFPLAPACSVEVTISSIAFEVGDCAPQVLTGPCPTFNHRYCVVIKNCGASSLPANSVLTISLDPDMTFITTIPTLFPPECNILSGTFPTFNIGAIPPGGDCSICFEVDVNAFTLPDWTTCATYVATACSDTDCAIDDIPCPCDPNDKLVAPKGCGPFNNIGIDEPLTYRVRFQNIGGTPANDVVIRDVLDKDLDLTTLRILASSDLITRGEIIPENQLLISYEGINLPDSASDPIGSNGFVVFRISPKSNAADGTQITNQAGIYFDFNEVVLTNTTLNTLRDNPKPIADFEAKHNCTNTGLVFDFTYTGGTADSATFFWDFGIGATPQTSTQQNPSGILFSTTGTKQITLTVTRFGCTASITKTVEVIDVSCGKNKVLVCHIPPGNPNKPQTICISKSALQAHLNHGDCIGSCNTAGARLIDESAKASPSGGVILTATPNPFSEKTEIAFMTNIDDEISIEVYNYSGQIVQQLYFAKAEAGKKSKVMFDSAGLSKGMYFIKAQTTREVQIIKLVLVQ